MNKTIIVKLPKGAEVIPVYKKISLDNEDSILIEVTGNTFGGDADNREPEPKVFFCYQEKVKIQSNPLDYSCIGTTSNHYVQLHPINPSRKLLYISSQSFDVLLKQIIEYRTWANRKGGTVL